MTEEATGFRICDHRLWLTHACSILIFLRRESHLSVEDCENSDKLQLKLDLGDVNKRKCS